MNACRIFVSINDRIGANLQVDDSPSSRLERKIAMDVDDIFLDLSSRVSYFADFKIRELSAPVKQDGAAG